MKNSYIFIKIKFNLFKVLERLVKHQKVLYFEEMKSIVFFKSNSK